MLTVSLSPPIAAVGHPARAWRQTFVAAVRGLPQLRLRPVLESAVRG